MKTTDSKSHTEQEIRSAIRQGKTLCHLDSGNSGNDDILIGGESEVRADVEGWALSCGYCEDGSDLWEGQGWTLRVMDPSELDDLEAGA
uniref:Uncharacterized protein n=1 Tax=viral metagenome TaxID=1070528 RepID=A0A6H1Z7V3_9ZZZZ